MFFLSSHSSPCTWPQDFELEKEMKWIFKFSLRNMELGWFANKSRLFRWVYLISGWRPASSFTSLSTACSRSALLKEWSHTELGVGVSKKQCQDTVLETWCNRHPITFTSSLCKGTQQDGVRGYKRTYQNEFYIIKNIYARTRP